MRHETARDLFTPVPYGCYVIGTSRLFFTAGISAAQNLHDMRHFSAATRQAHTAAATDAVLDKVTGQLPVKSSQVQIALAPDTTNPAGPDVMLKRPVSVLVMLSSGVSPKSSMQYCRMQYCHMKIG